MIRALLIDAKAREVREIEVPDDALARVEAMHEAIGGYLELAYMWTSGDALFVDEDGLRHAWPFGFVFHIPGTFPRSLVGSGIVIGREVEGDQYPDGYTNLDPSITADELRAIVRFIRQE